ncbi:MipA/OmpV family protein [Thiocapsa sp.]|uniref:MipA/OmpV family protein n=1 Tax=Thiocapsa sp. TaxID=2024551 RepID=UPI002BED47EB|nr:MipA/OmpV family protein [Thiocapsa sp.]HSO81674.1 MipA/OmpV family protein [Thiocapsa sp.]
MYFDKTPLMKRSPDRPKACRHAAVCTMLLALSCPVTWASDLAIPLELEQPNFAGVGVGAYPDYLGSDDAALGVAPFARISLGGERFVRVLANEVRLNALDHPNWQLGPTALLRFGRRNVDDQVVQRVHDIDRSLSMGLFGGYRWRDEEDARRQAGTNAWSLWDASGTYNGWTAGINAFYMQPVARPLTLAAGLGMTYASDNYMNEYFGVTQQDAFNSGLPAYAAGAGARDVRGWVTGVFHLGPQWHLATGVLFARLLSDAADSPIVSERGSENQWIYGASLLYAW